MESSLKMAVFTKTNEKWCLSIYKKGNMLGFLFIFTKTIGHFVRSFAIYNKWQIIWQYVKKIKQNWSRSGNFHICFCVSFEHYCQKFISGGETGHEPVSLPNFEILFSFLSLKSFGNSHYHIWYHVRFYSWQIKHSKWQKY